MKDSPEAVKAMKNVFMRLCTTTDELISVPWQRWRIRFCFWSAPRALAQVNDVMKVHNLLGEPMDDEDEKKMMAFFDTGSKSKLCPHKMF